ncbi:PQ-loop repeat-containing protein [Plasmodium brasilianum]|uniref:PQ-loop repeat-containing protein n=1 Tax=Plasmodium brasilianum TaxID=5824 RepID=A0ACB9Y9X4_PLABR|nr:PQ-loop repeat-containing protein [Plasmodium brasilianum]
MQRTNFNVFSEEFYDRQNVLSVSAKRKNKAETTQHALNNLLICSLIVGSCFVKLPQLKKIISNKNAAGLSIISFYLEIIVSTSLIAFSIKKKINYKLRAESFNSLLYVEVNCGFVSFLNIIILLQIFYYWNNTKKVLAQAEKKNL